MLKSPTVKYAQSGDVDIAYQVIGDGPVDLVFMLGFVSNLEVIWEYPSYARVLQRLASFSRLILFDKRGTGLSDRRFGVPILEQRSDDIRAILEVVGSQQAAIFGFSEGGPMSLLFAAAHPERVSALILWGARAWNTEYRPEAQIAGKEPELLKAMRQEWGEPWAINGMAPSLADDAFFREWWAKYLRQGASPQEAYAVIQLYDEFDVRDILSTIHVPAMVLHRRNDRVVGVENGRYLAKEIPEAKYIELKGSDHLWWVGDTSWLGDVEEFLTGIRPSKQPNRVLATVLFTDIVNSTQNALKRGDHQWRTILERHHHISEREITRFQGRAIKNTGDGFLATFDGPSRAIQCAQALREQVKRLGIEIRAGLHTGEIELIGDDVGGIAVHIAARVLSKAADDEVWVSRTVKDLVTGSGFRFREQGLFQLKGIPDEWPLFVVEQ